MADPNKPGYRTTEFYLTLAASLVGGLLTSGLFADGSRWMRGLGVAAMVLSVLGYTVTRGALKQTNAKVANDNAVDLKVDVASAAERKAQAGFVDGRILVMMIGLTIAAAIATIGCSALGKDAKAVASSVIDCTKKETSASVHELRPLGDSMLSNALSGGSLDWGGIDNLAKGFVTDIGRCVLADAVSRALNPPPVDPNAPKVSPLQVDHDALRSGFRTLSAQRFGGVTFRTDNGNL